MQGSFNAKSSSRNVFDVPPARLSGPYYLPVAMANTSDQPKMGLVIGKEKCPAGV